MAEFDELYQTVFFPVWHRRRKAVKDQKIRFVHYTSAEVAMNIIRHGQVWMRKANAMNDFQEIEHGLACLDAAWNDGQGSLPRVLDEVVKGISQQIWERFNQYRWTYQFHTYLTCVSEHHDSEDLTGRLSMWRAYGGTTGVAIVMNNKPFIEPSDALRAYTSPVEYLWPEGFAQRMAELAEGITRNIDYVRRLQPHEIFYAIMEVLRYAVLSTKHPGFGEELEWRVVYSPSVHPSPRLITAVESVNGVPQPVIKLPLKDVPDEGLIGIEVPQLVDRIIVGPTQHPQVIVEALAMLMQEAGVERPHSRIARSNVPLRR